MTPVERNTALPRRRFLARLLAGMSGLSVLREPKPAMASPQGYDPYLGEIMIVPYDFPPRGWAFCNGQLLPISQNQALFTILGTTYGGNGVTTFALPNFQGRTPIHRGQGLGLSPRVLGERAGAETHTLNLAELPAHIHVARGSSLPTTADPSSSVVPARNAAGIPAWSAGPFNPMNSGTISFAGSGQPHMNMQPYLTLNYVIAMVGIYPSP
jgi:microcystin-dependent protein